MRSFFKDSDLVETTDKIFLPEPIFKFKRWEKKYLVNSAVADLLKGQIGFYIPKDKRTLEFPYINSIYYDNSEWKCYKEQLDKVNPRFKVRFRQYEKNKDFSGKGFLEIKRKVDSLSVKDRFKINIQMLESLSDSPISSEILLPNKKFGIESLSEIYYKITSAIIKYNLEQVAEVTYFREAFENCEKTLRITFDSNLGFNSLQNKFAEPLTLSYRMPEDFLVMEVKYAGRIPEWLSSLLKFNKLTNQHFSKYCTAIHYLYNTEKIDWQPKLSLFNKNYSNKEYGNTQNIVINSVQF
jgi:SPX domain protein involved in polyphosphate accumulation